MLRSLSTLSWTPRTKSTIQSTLDALCWIVHTFERCRPWQYCMGVLTRIVLYRILTWSWHELWIVAYFCLLSKQPETGFWGFIHIPRLTWLWPCLFGFKVLWLLEPVSTDRFIRDDCAEHKLITYFLWFLWPLLAGSTRPNALLGPFSHPTIWTFEWLSQNGFYVTSTTSLKWTVVKSDAGRINAWHVERVKFRTIESS